MSKILLVVGHCKSGDRGAYSKILKLTEYEYNKQVAYHLVKKYPELYESYEHTIQGYNSRQNALANFANKRNYKAIIELHFNMFNGIAQGAEALHYVGSVNGYKIARALADDISCYYEIPNRGAKSIVKGQNGFGFLQKMKATAVIVEPFFGDEKEAEKFQNYVAYAEILNLSLKKVL